MIVVQFFAPNQYIPGHNIPAGVAGFEIPVAKVVTHTIDNPRRPERYL